MFRNPNFVSRCGKAGLRFYIPDTGRWLNRDPIGELGGMNEIIFVANDSISAIDALGLRLTKITQDVARLPWRSHSQGPAAGKTRFGWPFDISILHAYSSPAKVEVTGKPAFFYYSLLDGYERTDRIYGPSSNTIEEHEKLHAEVFKKRWNDLKAVVDPYEGEYCDRNCAILARLIVEELNDRYKQIANKENAQIHITTGETNDIAGERAAVAAANRAIASINVRLSIFRSNFVNRNCELP